MKRFYTKASTAPLGEGHAILLDGMPIKTPAGNVLAVPTDALAKALAAEWQAQGEKIITATMPLMQMAATVVDYGERNRKDIRERLLAYVKSDLLCYYVEEPPELQARQEKLFAPKLQWLHRRYAIHLNIATALLADTQPEGAMPRMEAVLAALDDWKLMGVQTAALASGSLVLALGLMERAFTAREVFDAAEVEHSFQLEKWGGDPAAEARQAGVLFELQAVERWFGLLAF
jgi:chaperone required for assembly of F1-ATPase